MMTPVDNCTYFFSTFLSPVQYSILSLVLLFLFTIYLFKSGYLNNKISLVGLLLIVFGGISNLYWRGVDFCVADNIKIGVIYVNIADIVVILGIIMLGYKVLFWGGEQVD